jgi:uncharacterized protein YciI
MSALTPLVVVTGEYLTPIAEVDAHREAHLRFIARLVGDGRVLLAGRRTPPEGSVIIFRGADPDEALRLLDDDPYRAAGVVAYDAVGVFTPGAHAPELAAALAAGGG